MSTQQEICMAISDALGKHGFVLTESTDGRHLWDLADDNVIAAGKVQPIERVSTVTMDWFREDG